MYQMNTMDDWGLRTSQDLISRNWNIIFHSSFLRMATWSNVKVRTTNLIVSHLSLARLESRLFFSDAKEKPKCWYCSDIWFVSSALQIISITATLNKKEGKKEKNAADAEI